MTPSFQLCNGSRHYFTTRILFENWLINTRALITINYCFFSQANFFLIAIFLFRVLAATFILRCVEL